jgi:predicted kinase
MGAAPIVVVTGPTGAGKTAVSRLVAEAFPASVDVRMDDFTRFTVNGWDGLWRPEGTHENHVFGGAAANAALTFAEGGFTAVLDGHVFPEGLAGLAAACRWRDVPLHYAVLRPDLDVCIARADARDGTVDGDGIARQHHRFRELGHLEAHVLDATGTPEQVAAHVLDAFRAGRLAVPPK